MLDVSTFTPVGPVSSSRRIISSTPSPSRGVYLDSKPTHSPSPDWQSLTESISISRLSTDGEHEEGYSVDESVPEDLNLSHIHPFSRYEDENRRSVQRLHGQQQEQREYDYPEAERNHSLTECDPVPLTVAKWVSTSIPTPTSRRQSMPLQSNNSPFRP